ncbi:hypothetical protein AHAS_Ahas15G0057400 [Arachis hypogaea]
MGAKKFATKEAAIFTFQNLYCLVQWTPGLSLEDCRSCLDGLINSNLLQCCVEKHVTAGVHRSFITMEENRVPSFSSIVAAGSCRIVEGATAVLVVASFSTRLFSESISMVSSG